MQLRKDLTSIPFSGIAAIAQRAQALGADVIRLEIGDVDIQPHHSLSNAIMQCLNEGQVKYPAVAGDADLAKAVRDEIGTNENIHLGNDQLVITNGGSMALFAALLTSLGPGDEAIVIEPVWPHIKHMISLIGAVPVLVATDPDHSHRINFQEVQRAITTRTRVIVINSPNNPTGNVLSTIELQRLAIIAQEGGLAIISDEEYCDFVFPSGRAESIFQHHPDTFVIRSFSKSFAISGLRLGFLFGPSSWIEQAKKVGLFTSMYSSSLMQRAVANCFGDLRSHVKTVVSTFHERAKVFVDGVSLSSNICANAPEGSVYAWLDCRKTGIEDVTLAYRILDEKRVATVPGSVFGASGAGFLRVSLGAERDQLAEAARRIQEFDRGL